jgi:hypothetical protein
METQRRADRLCRDFKLAPLVLLALPILPEIRLRCGCGRLTVMLAGVFDKRPDRPIFVSAIESLWLFLLSLYPHCNFPLHRHSKLLGVIPLCDVIRSSFVIPVPLCCHSEPLGAMSRPCFYVGEEGVRGISGHAIPTLSGPRLCGRPLQSSVNYNYATLLSYYDLTQNPPLP